jgi:hypothetical protein
MLKIAQGRARLLQVDVKIPLAVELIDLAKHAASGIPPGR